MITIPVQIRPSDHDSLGHVNNAAYVAFVQHAVAEFLARQGYSADWRIGAQYHWMLRELTIEYRRVSSFGDQLMSLVWLAEADERHLLFGSELYHDHEDMSQRQLAVRARTRWQRQESSTGKVAKLRKSFLQTAEQSGRELPQPYSPPAASGEVRSFQWRHSVQRSEVGPGGRAHPHVIFEWIEESILGASKEAGWPIERLLAADFVVLQMRHDAEFDSLPVLDEAVEITSSLVQVRRLRGTWHNEIRSLDDGRLLISNYSTGVFLNLASRPTSPPPGMMDDLQKPVA